MLLNAALLPHVVNILICISSSFGLAAVGSRRHILVSSFCPASFSACRGGRVAILTLSYVTGRTGCVKGAVLFTVVILGTQCLCRSEGCTYSTGT